MGSPDRARSVLFLRPTMGRGGADRVTSTLLRSLDRDRFRPQLALMRREGELLAELPADVPIHDLEAPGLSRAAGPLGRLLQQVRPDVLFSTSGGANVVAVLAARRAGFGGRLVLSERNALLRDQPPLKKWTMLLLKRLLYRHADLVTAVSEGVRGDLLRRLRLSADRVRTVFNPIVTPELEARAAAGLEDAWLEGSAPLLLAAGRLETAKDFPTLLRALTLVRRRRPARLVILGEGSQRRRLERLVGEGPGASVVRLPGFERNPLRWMARCTLFVLSSRFEGLPGVLVQAMACGAPVVATDCPFGPAEIVRRPAEGMLVPVGDERAMADAIVRLLADPEARRAQAEEGRRAAGRFTLDRILPLYEAALTGDPESP